MKKKSSAPPAPELHPYKFPLANLTVGGIEFTEIKNGKIRNRISFELGGFKCELRRSPETFYLKHKDCFGRSLHTGELIVHDVPIDKKAAVKQMAEEVAELLSFAINSQVDCFGESYDGQSIRRSIHGIALGNTPALSASQLPSFLTQVWPGYRVLRAFRMLHIVFEYILTSQLPGQPFEVKILLGSVTLECLKSTFAQTRGYQYHKPAWRRISVPPKADPMKEPQLGFAALLTEMLGEVNMPAPLPAIIELRNEVVHNGISIKPHGDQLVAYQATQDLLREYLLRRLGYHGVFRQFSDWSQNTIP
jgi:hypothetical protein